LNPSNVLTIISLEPSELNNNPLLSFKVPIINLLVQVLVHVKYGIILEDIDTTLDVKLH
jgi:hypothetical protein